MTSRREKRSNACDLTSGEEWTSDEIHLPARKKRAAAAASTAVDNTLPVGVLPVLPLEIWDVVTSHACVDAPSTFLWSRVCKDFQSCISRAHGLSMPLFINPDQLLIYAASSNFPSVVENALTCYVPSYLRDDRIDNAIAHACINNRLELAKDLVSKSAGATHLFNNLGLFTKVCARGHLDVARWIYSFGRVKVVYPWDAFTLACQRRHMHLAQWLFSVIGYSGMGEDGAHMIKYVRAVCGEGDLEMTDWLETIGRQHCSPAELLDTMFGPSCASGDLALAKRMVKYTYATFDFTKGLNVAAAKGHDDICAWLLEKQHFPNLRDAFLLCCGHGHLSTAKILFQHRNQSLDQGVAEAAHVACVNGHLHVASWLHSEIGSDPFTRAHSYGPTFRLAVEAGHLDVSKFLLDIDGDWIDSESLANACWAAQLRSIQWCYELNIIENVRANADVAFANACSGGNVEVAKWLHNQGIVNRAALSDVTHFTNACENAHLDLAQWLLELGRFDVAAVELSNLHRVIIKGNLKMVRWLHEQGCPVISNHRNTFFPLACEHGHFRLAKWLHDEIGADWHSAFPHFVRGNCVDGLLWLIHMQPTFLTQCNHELFGIACHFGCRKVARFLYNLGAVDLSKIDRVALNCHHSVLAWLYYIQRTAPAQNTR